jgi:hypothetical protein
MHKDFLQFAHHSIDYRNTKLSTLIDNLKDRKLNYEPGWRIPGAKGVFVGVKFKQQPPLFADDDNSFASPSTSRSVSVSSPNNDAIASLQPEFASPSSSLASPSVSSPSSLLTFESYDKMRQEWIMMSSKNREMEKELKLEKAIRMLDSNDDDTNVRLVRENAEKSAKIQELNNELEQLQKELAMLKSKLSPEEKKEEEKVVITAVKYVQPKETETDQQDANILDFATI